MILTLARDNSGRCVGLQLPAEPADIAAAYEKLDTVSTDDRQTRILRADTGIGSLDRWLRDRKMDRPGDYIELGELSEKRMTPPERRNFSAPLPPENRMYQGEPKAIFQVSSVDQLSPELAALKPHFLYAPAMLLAENYDKVLPFLTDTRDNLETILGWCIDAGVKGIICWNIGMTLREGDRDYYYHTLDRYFPGLSQKYREVYGNSYEVVSLKNAELMPYFHEQCEKHGILHTPEDCFSYMHELPERYEQMTLF